MIGIIVLVIQKKTLVTTLLMSRLSSIKRKK